MATRDQAATRDGRPARSGFTLVELLVVIMIIGLLAALVVPAVMRSQATARNARIKAEIDMLHMAIMNYKNEYGSFPPSDGFAISSTSDSTKHVQRLFPRCPNAMTQLTSVLAGTTPGYVCPTNALSFWLSGFTSDPTQPLTPGSRKKLFDFDRARLNTSTGAYWPSGKQGSPYIYIDSVRYLTYPYVVSNLSQVCAQRVPTTPPSASDASAFATALGGAISPPFANADTFQILCAGSDEIFGTDDDLSNFWPGTRRDYLDSLKQ